MADNHKSMLREWQNRLYYSEKCDGGANNER